MDWKNIDLDSHEVESNILDPYTLETLLLEISCNIRKEDINRDSVMKQFETVLASKLEDARFIMEHNLDNIVKKARKS
jgi:hypothetical protein